MSECGYVRLYSLVFSFTTNEDMKRRDSIFYSEYFFIQQNKQPEKLFTFSLFKLYVGISSRKSEESRSVKTLIEKGTIRFERTNESNFSRNLVEQEILADHKC